MESSTLYPFTALSPSSQLQQYFQHYGSVFLDTLTTASLLSLGSQNDKTERLRRLQKQQEELFRYYEEKKKQQQQQQQKQSKQQEPDNRGEVSGSTTVDNIATFEQSAQQLITTFMKDPHLKIESATKHSKFENRQSTPLWELLKHLKLHLTARNSFILNSSIGFNIDKYIPTSTTSTCSFVFISKTTVDDDDDDDDDDD
jgi:hypothetical protein